MLVGGDLTTSDETFETEAPSTGEVLTTVPRATQADVDRAIQAAQQASDRWTALSLSERRSKMEAFATHAQEHVDELLNVEVANNGSTISLLRSDIERGINRFNYFGGLITELKGDTNPVDGHRISMTKREPYGVVAKNVPFNHPAMFALSKIAAAIGAGNSIVLKPSEVTPLSALSIGRIVQKFDGFPPGLVNIITGGATVGKMLVEHPGVGAISHTGGVESGKAVMESAAKNLTPVSLELGGKNPIIVFPDTSIEKAADGVVGGMSLKWQGQSCQSGTRLLAHADIYDELVDRVVERFEALNCGDPFDPSADMGAVVSKSHFDRVMEYIETGKEEGATLLTGGEPARPGDEGYFIKPTIFEVEPGMTIEQEEIFGPVLSILKWQDYNEMLEIANGVRYGLTGSVWTDDLSTAHQTADQIDAGIVWVNEHVKLPINAPAGGFKHSGFGKNFGIYELEHLTREKHVYVNAEGPHRG